MALQSTGLLKRCEHLFLHQGMAKEDTIGLTSFHLEDDTQLRFLELERDQWLSQNSFKNHFNLHYWLPFQSNKLRELLKQRQDGTMVEYQHRFEQQPVGALPSQEVETFISVLQDHITWKSSCSTHPIWLPQWVSSSCMKWGEQGKRRRASKQESINDTKKTTIYQKTWPEGDGR